MKNKKDKAMSDEKNVEMWLKAFEDDLDKDGRLTQLRADVHEGRDVKPSSKSFAGNEWAFAARGTALDKDGPNNFDGPHVGVWLESAKHDFNPRTEEWTRSGEVLRVEVSVRLQLPKVRYWPKLIRNGEGVAELIRLLASYSASAAVCEDTLTSIYPWTERKAGGPFVHLSPENGVWDSKGLWISVVAPEPLNACDVSAWDESRNQKRRKSAVEQVRLLWPDFVQLVSFARGLIKRKSIPQRAFVLGAIGEFVAWKRLSSPDRELHWLTGANSCDLIDRGPSRTAFEVKTSANEILDHAYFSVSEIRRAVESGPNDYQLVRVGVPDRALDDVLRILSLARANAQPQLVADSLPWLLPFCALCGLMPLADKQAVDELRATLDEIAKTKNKSTQFRVDDNPFATEPRRSDFRNALRHITDGRIQIALPTTSATTLSAPDRPHRKPK